MSFDLDKHGWDILDAYFANVSHYISKNQIDSYNMFTDEQISKTIRQFNPIQLNYKITDTEEYEVDIIVGGKTNGNEVINDGSSIRIGKPIISEKIYHKDSETNTEKVITINKQLYPNEARLKNLTYTMSVYVDIHCLYRKSNLQNIYEKDTFLGIKSYTNVLLGKIPAMLHSKVCVLSEIPQNNLKDFGECQYDQGGYFIIDGKEKVITAQTRQVENKIYVYEKVKDDKVEFHAEIRSVPEDKLQPARITNVYLKRPEQNLKDIQNNKEALLYVSIPNFKEQIPIFILFRALGVLSDKEILEIMIGDLDTPLGDKLTTLLYDNILIANDINTQIDAMKYLQNLIRNFDGFTKNDISNYSKEDDKNRYINTLRDKQDRDFKYIMDILYNYLLPHIGTTNLYDKAIFLGYMVNQLLLTKLKVIEPTDRDNYMYKRIDVSGFLVATIFRDLYFRVQNKLKYSINKHYVSKQTSWNDIDILNLVDSEKLPQYFDSLLMTDGFKYAFKNCWGLRDAPCKEGVVQDLARLTYVGETSHLRRVVTPIDASNKLRGPHMLHLSTYGILCPIETPDGANVGVKTNIAMFTDITFGTHSSGIYQALLDNGLIPISIVNVAIAYKNKYTKVFLNGRLVGYTDIPDRLTYRLKLFRRNAIINVYTSIAWYINTMEIKISTDSGRCCHPILIVKNNKLAMNNSIFTKLKNKEITWDQLLGGTLRKWHQYDNKYHRENVLDNDKLELTSSVAEYIDTEEANTCMIAMNAHELTNNKVNYTHCEINPCVMFGIMGQLIPYVSTNQLPRNLYSCGQCKQAIGVYASNFRNRMDTKTQILQYPEKPLVQNRIAKHLYNNQLPYGINATVAIACYSGYNQDDSIIFNKSSLDRGLFKTTKFRTYAIREEVSEFTKLRSKICNPANITDKNVVIYDLKPGNYSKLGENGIIREGVKVDENDIVCGKVIITNEKDLEGRTIYKDASEYVRRAETGIIDKVYYSYDNNDFLFVKVRLRKEKRPELGDKFASRAGQKGIMGMILSESDMPYTKHGIKPDLMINPQAFPKRMTISQFIETQQTKQCSLLGIFGDSSPFQDISLDKMGEALERLGFEKTGCEILYNGMTGEPLEHEIFIGPTYYGRLQHQVEDKMHSRDTGAVTMLTKQPTGGRSIGGGLRIGEMERDALLSHGISSFLKESMMERSDKHSMIICNGCGFIAMVNPQKNIYKCYSCNSTKVSYIDGKITKDQIENSKNDFSLIELPYSMKLMTQELEAMSVASRIITYSESSKWRNVDKYSTILDIDTNLITNGDNTDLFIVSSAYGKDEPFRKYQNLLKDNLINGAQSYVTGGRKPHLLDLSTYRGGDIIKWINNNYGYVLAIDQNEDNIFTHSKCFVNRLIKARDNPKFIKFFNDSKIDYGVANLDRSLYDGSAFKHTKVNNILNLRNILSRRGKSSFDIVSLQFTIQKVFDNIVSLHNCLQNIADSLRIGGVAIISALDGEKVFNMLSVENLVFSYIDAGKKYPVYSIDKMYDTKLNSLPDNDNSLGFKINLQFGSSESNSIEYLVNNKFLISEAKKFGLRIMDLSEFNNNFKNLSFPYNNFSHDINNIDSPFSKTLLTENYSELLEFNNLFTYFVFVKHEIPIITSNNLILCNKLNYVKILNLGIKDILYERSIIGLPNTTPINIKPIDTLLIDSLSNKLNIDYKYEKLSLYNTIKLLEPHTKSLIYCYIKNNNIVIYSPMFNTINTTENVLITNNYEKILELTLQKFRYYPELADTTSITKNINYWHMLGCKLKTYPFKFNDLYFNTMLDMFTKLAENRSIPDIEFILHLEDTPSNITDRQKTIFSLSTNNNSYDIPLPTPLDWYFITKNYFVNKDKCHNTYFDMRGLEDLLPKWSNRRQNVIFRGSSKGCSNNIRLKVLDYLYNTKLDNLDFKITKWDRETILNGDTFSFTKGYKLSEQDSTLTDFILPDFSETNEKYTLRSLANNKYILYLDSYGASLKYSYLMTLGSVIVKFKSHNKLWYSDLTKPFILSIDTIVNDHDHILLEKIEDLNLLSKWILENDSLAEKIAINCKKLSETIFNKEYIYNYLEYVLTNTHNKYNNNIRYDNSEINLEIKRLGLDNITKNISISNRLIKVINDNRQKLSNLFNVNIETLDGDNLGLLQVNGSNDNIDKFVNYIEKMEDWKITKFYSLNSGLVKELSTIKEQVENHFDVYLHIINNDVYVFSDTDKLTDLHEILNDTLTSMPLIVWYANRKIVLNIDMTTLLNIVDTPPIAIICLSDGLSKSNTEILTSYLNTHNVEYNIYHVTQSINTNIPNIPIQITYGDDHNIKPNYLALLKAINGVITSKYERLIVYTNYTTINKISDNFISECERINRDIFLVNNNILYVKSRFNVKTLYDMFFGMELSQIPNMFNYTNSLLIDNTNNNNYTFNYDSRYEKINIDYFTNTYFKLIKDTNNIYNVILNQNCFPVFLTNEIDKIDLPYDYLTKYLYRFIGEDKLDISEIKTKKIVNSVLLEFPIELHTLVYRIILASNYMYNILNSKTGKFNIIETDSNNIIKIEYKDSLETNIEKILQKNIELLPYYTINNEYYIHNYSVKDAELFSNSLKQLKLSTQIDKKLVLPKLDKKQYLFITRIGNYVFYYNINSDDVSIFNLFSDNFTTETPTIFKKLDINLLLIIYKNNNDSMLKLVLNDTKLTYKSKQLKLQELVVPQLTTTSTTTTTQKSTNKYDLLNLDIAQNNYTEKSGFYYD